MTRQEAFERNLSLHQDTLVLRGKFSTLNSTTTTPNVALFVTPTSFGARSGAVSTVFSRYRIKELIIRFMPNSTGTAAIAALGVLDDVNTSSVLPTNYQAITELRCSATQFEGVTVEKTLTWSPIDKSKWYYTTADTVGDPRFSVPAVIYCAASATVSISIEVDYTIVFQGAADTGSS